jgi:hypothetical protein
MLYIIYLCVAIYVLCVSIVMAEVSWSYVTPSYVPKICLILFDKNKNHNIYEVICIQSVTVCYRLGNNA